MDNEANIIFGAVLDPNMTDELRITVIATGFKAQARRQPIGRSASTATTPAQATREQRASNILEMPRRRPRDDNDDLEIPAFLRNR